MASFSNAVALSICVLSPEIRTVISLEPSPSSSSTVDLFRSKLVKLFSPRKKRRDGSENVYTAEAGGERLHGGIRRRLTEKMMSPRKKRASKGKDKGLSVEFGVGAGDEEGEAQTKLRRDGEDSGARGNKDGVVGKPNERKAAKQEDEAVNKRLPTQTDTGEDKCLKEVKRWRGRWVHYWAALWGSLRMADCATDDGVWGGEGRGLGSMGQ
ncbi:unnamed protein product [Brassica oleracea]|uniref:(rape) hypothetical protein n=1 Tax=Brassica napus TaxID=3708 RepID=A0A816IY40_BRANA|nr:unnamed protein product [Brassica napus]